MVFALVVAVSGISCFAIRQMLLYRYESGAADQQIAKMKNHCAVLGDQMSTANYLQKPISDVIDARLSQLSDVYDGRILVIDSEFRIMKDTFDAQTGKTIVSQDVIECFKGSGTSRYDRQYHYIEITTPIMGRYEDTPYVAGVLLISSSAAHIKETLDDMSLKANILTALIMVLVTVAAAYASYGFSLPLKRLTDRVNALAEGTDFGETGLRSYTETARLSEAVDRLKNRVSEQENSKSEFIANVSHELKTPLTSMKILADSLLAEEDAPIETYKEFMGDIAGEIERESALVNDLLELVRTEKDSSEMNVASENINALTERVLTTLRPIAEKNNVDLVLESLRPVTAEVDADKLAVALTNLVENAIKYNKKEGWVHVSVNSDHRYFYIAVADSGIGIPSEDTGRVFERFYRGDKSHSSAINGTGLGLAIAKNVVTEHRGVIKVISEEGVGTTFTVRIPLKYVP